MLVNIWYGNLGGPKAYILKSGGAVAPLAPLVPPPMILLTLSACAEGYSTQLVCHSFILSVCNRQRCFRRQQMASKSVSTMYWRHSSVFNQSGFLTTGSILEQRQDLNSILFSAHHQFHTTAPNRCVDHLPTQGEKTLDLPRR